MLYSRSFLLLAGLPAVLSFGAAPARPGEGYEVTVATESASAQVNNDALQLPDDMCSKLLDQEIIGIDNPNEWCNTGKPAKSKCENGNRLRLGKSTITTLGSSVIFDVCQWDEKKNKCALAAVSYICRDDCPGVPQVEGDGRPPDSPWATDVYIQTDCSLKTEVSAGSWYEDPPGSGEYTQRYVTDVKDKSCKQKLVRCLPGESFIASEDCNKNVDKCCWSPKTVLTLPVARRLKEEELPKPARRLQVDGVCKDMPEGTTTEVLTNDKGENSICCVAPAASDGKKLRPTQEWLDENNPGGLGYYKGDPLTDKRQYGIFEKCKVSDNECVCTTEEILLGKDGPTCPAVPPVAWGKAKASGRRA